jgi:ankyrin repeat protein
VFADEDLLDASRNGRIDQAVEAIQCGADIECRDHYGRTPLYHALTRGHLSLAELLVRQGANVNTQFGKRRQTLLHWAAEQGAYGVASFLLQHQADVNSRRIDGITPLHLAARKGHTYLVNLLLRNGADFDARATGDRIPRDLAIKAGHQDLARILEVAADYRVAGFADAEDLRQQDRSSSMERTPD